MASAIDMRTFGRLTDKDDGNLSIRFPDLKFEKEFCVPKLAATIKDKVKTSGKGKS